MVLELLAEKDMQVSWMLVETEVSKFGLLLSQQWSLFYALSALTLLVGRQEGIRPVKTLEGLWGWGAISSVGVAPTRTVGTSASIIFPCSIKIQKTGWGNPAWTQHSPMLRQKAECFFWYRPTRVVPEQRPLNGCCCCWSLFHLYWSTTCLTINCSQLSHNFDLRQVLLT